MLLESTAKGTGQPDLEDYDYPACFSDRARGKHLSHRADYQLAEGSGDQPSLCGGHLLEISEHPRREWNSLRQAPDPLQTEHRAAAELSGVTH